MKVAAPRAWLGGDELAADVVLDVVDGAFASVETGVSAPDDALLLDGIVMPGLVDAHSHAFHRALRGVSWGDDDFWGWRDRMYRVAAELDPDRYRRVAEITFSEMLAAGITSLGEFHYVRHRPDGSRYEDPLAMAAALAEAANATGIRLTLIDACYLTADADGAPVGPGQRRFAHASAEEWRDQTLSLVERLAAWDLVSHAVAVHSVRAVPPPAIELVATTARELGTSLHVHVSEQRAENEDCLRAHGVTPVELLHHCGALGPTTTLVHATHLTDRDLDLVAASGAGVCLCPTTERDLGDGIGPAEALAQAAVPICLGSDSNAVVDLWEEMRAVEMNDRLRAQRRGIHSPSALLAAATSAGAVALGQDTGRIAPGRPADLIVVGGDRSLLGVPFTPAGLVTAARSASVREVMVAGLVVEPARPDPGPIEELRS